MLTAEAKTQIRWELAEINNSLNKALKDACAAGPRQSTENLIHELRSRRDTLMQRLQNI